MSKRFQSIFVSRFLLALGLLASHFCLVRCLGQDSEASLREADFFESRIRPILVEHCQECHSLATQKSSGGLLLDSREGWHKGGDSGAVIVPNKPAESLLVRAVRHGDGVSPMPPTDSGRRLSESQVQDLEAWILRGAYDPRQQAPRLGGMDAEQARLWWAFQPIKSIEPPAVMHPEWVWNPIDRFIVAKLEAQRVDPVLPASKQAWLRRVTLDLTGMVPTPEQIDVYMADDTPNANETIVDRLLASYEHAERYGRHWLDVARYADTAGDGADYPVREAYKYRDWVIRAIHRNKPWDQFLREQIAGDLYAQDLFKQGLGDGKTDALEEYSDLVTATGFLAIGKRYGYAPNTDFQHLDFADVIDSIGRSVLGLSIGCARCHDHKYDPISMQDYYGLYGILQSTRWAFPGGEEHKRPANFPPLLPPQQVRQLEEQRDSQLRELDASIQAAQVQRSKLDPSFHAGGIDLDLEAQEIGKPPSKAWLSAGPNQVTAESQSPFEHIFGQGSRGVRIGSGTPHEGVRYVFAQKAKLIDKPLFFTIDFRIPKSADGSQDPDGSCRLYLGRGVIESTAIECSITKNQFAIKDAGQWKVIGSLETDKWYHLQLKLDPGDMTYSGGIYGLEFYAQVPKVALPTNWDRIADTFICDGFGHGSSGVITRELDNVGLDTEAFAPFGSAPFVRPSKTPAGQEAIASLDQQIKALESQRANIATQVLYPVAYGVGEAESVDARIQLRGEPSKLDQEVPRGYLAVLGGHRVDPTGGQSGRRDLAQWLTDSSRPLAARVFVNRLWHWHFGKGLVSTTSDFGLRGSDPSHPELLEYLAGRFMESGWDVRALHRLIVLSRTYHLASYSSDSNDPLSAHKALELDPENRLLWRHTKRPVDAESLRDSILSICGLLDRNVPKEHPFPPVDSWGFTIHNPFHGVYDSMHRSVYLMQQRNRKNAYLSLFDGADPNLSVDERKPTTTPTQSLFLMNSPLVHRASESLATRLIESRQDQSSRLQELYKITLGRFPSDQEQQECLDFMRVYSGQEASIALGDTELKTWSALCRVLMTSNSFLYID